MKLKCLIAAVVWCGTGILSVSCGNRNVFDARKLESRIDSIAGQVDAEVGAAVLYDGELAVAGEAGEYPLASVVKLPQAIAVCGFLERTGRTLDEIVHITRQELQENTYSPLRDTFPEGNIDLTVRELLEYSLGLSDNNACDILFSRFVTPAQTDSCIRSYGIDGFSISMTEAQMHENIGNSYFNTASPSAAVYLLEKLCSGEILGPEMQGELMEIMRSCTTGNARLQKGLEGTDAVLAHKTGSGDTDETGRLTAVNDVGIVELPDGRHYCIAVFVKNADEPAEVCEAAIAGISRMVYETIAVQ